MKIRRHGLYNPGTLENFFKRNFPIKFQNGRKKTIKRFFPVFIFYLKGRRILSVLNSIFLWKFLTASKIRTKYNFKSFYSRKRDCKRL